MEDLPRKNLTLKQYCDLCALLQSDPSTIEDFVRLNVSGVHDGHQVCVDALRNEMSEDEEFTIERDIDSFLGFSENMYLQSPVSIHVLSNNYEVLKKDLHIVYPFRYGNVRACPSQF